MDDENILTPAMRSAMIIFMKTNITYLYSANPYGTDDLCNAERSVASILVRCYDQRLSGWSY